MVIPILSNSDINRFWSKVAITANSEKCWNWIGSKRRRGYGQFHVSISPNKERNLVSTRVSYLLHYKIDPLEKIVLHKCDNPSCVNPNHLSLGTNKDNTKDMMNKNRGTKQFENGEKHSQSKLTEIQVLEIRELYPKSNLTQKEFAKNYNVDASLISIIVNRKRWTHI
jgi:hypothetical protein